MSNSHSFRFRSPGGGTLRDCNRFLPWISQAFHQEIHLLSTELFQKTICIFPGLHLGLFFSGVAMIARSVGLSIYNYTQLPKSKPQNTYTYSIYVLAGTSESDIRQHLNWGDI